MPTLLHNKMMKIYSPFEGGWRDSARGMSHPEGLTSPGARKRVPPPLLRGIF